MSYRTEFPDFDKKLYIPEGFEDNSWHNDTMPHVEKHVSGVSGEYRFSIWQNYEDVELREGGCGCNHAYYFQIEASEECEIILDYGTDNLEDIKKLVASICL